MKVQLRESNENYQEGLVHGDPVLNRIFRSRGVQSPDELKYDLNKLLPPNFKDMDKATDIIVKNIYAEAKIRVIGDYDADGATSVAVASRFFTEIKYDNFDYYIPSRKDEGYGVNREIVDKAKSDKVDLIITVDNGISAIDVIDYAKSLGISVIITDHHIPQDVLPNADAIVNPHQKDCMFASKCIAGVGVIFYVLSCTCTKLKKKGYFEERQIVPPLMSSFLDLVSIGTISDMVPMDFNNRIMCDFGVKLVRTKKSLTGILELVMASGCTLIGFKTTDISFYICPRLNAAGRIDDMRHGVELLIDTDKTKAKSKANYLNYLNNKRKQIEKEMRQIADRKIISDYGVKTNNGIVIYDQSFNIGVVGILANKLKEQHKTPIIVLTDTSATEISGSCRSTDALNIHEILTLMNEENEGLIVAFGGHKKAAGLTIKKENLEIFSELFSKYVEKNSSSIEESTIVTDGVLPVSYLDLSFARYICFDQPWGQDFEAPTFIGDFWVLSQYASSSSLLRFNFALENGEQIQGLYFSFDETKWPNSNAKKVRIVYSLSCSSNSERGKVSLIIRHIEALQ